jgi:hypothetical protein
VRFEFANPGFDLAKDTVLLSTQFSWRKVTGIWDIALVVSSPLPVILLLIEISLSFGGLLLIELCVVQTAHLAVPISKIGICAYEVFDRLLGVRAIEARPLSTARPATSSVDDLTRWSSLSGDVRCGNKEIER